MNIFLDLENTIIDSWDNPVFLEEKIDFIKNKLQKFDSEEKTLILFSFAVDNNHSLNIFNERLKYEIENLFNLQFSKIVLFSKDNLFKIAKQAFNIEPLVDDNINDIFLGNTKEQIFEALILKEHLNETSILFDDTVSNSIKEVFEDNIFSSKSTKLITIRV